MKTSLGILLGLVLFTSCGVKQEMSQLKSDSAAADTRLVSVMESLENGVSQFEADSEAFSVSNISISCTSGTANCISRIYTWYNVHIMAVAFDPVTERVVKKEPVINKTVYTEKSARAINGREYLVSKGSCHELGKNVALQSIS